MRRFRFMVLTVATPNRKLPAPPPITKAFCSMGKSMNHLIGSNPKGRGGLSSGTHVFVLKS